MELKIMTIEGEKLSRRILWLFAIHKRYSIDNTEKD